MRVGFTLVELMIVVGIIAILFAVSLPMYTTFRQKAKVGTALRGCSGAVQALQAYYDNSDSTHEGFSDIDIPGPDGGALMADDTRVGVGLPTVNGMEWDITVESPDSITIGFSWLADSSCPSVICDGHYCLDCSHLLDTCYIAIRVGNGSLGFDRIPSSPNAPASCP